MGDVALRQGSGTALTVIELQGSDPSFLQTPGLSNQPITVLTNRDNADQPYPGGGYHLRYRHYG